MICNLHKPFIVKYIKPAITSIPLISSSHFPPTTATPHYHSVCILQLPLPITTQHVSYNVSSTLKLPLTPNSLSLCRRQT